MHQRRDARAFDWPTMTDGGSASAGVVLEVMDPTILRLPGVRGRLVQEAGVWRICSRLVHIYNIFDYVVSKGCWRHWRHIMLYLEEEMQALPGSRPEELGVMNRLGAPDPHLAAEPLGADPSARGFLEAGFVLQHRMPLGSSLPLAGVSNKPKAKHGTRMELCIKKQGKCRILQHKYTYNTWAGLLLSSSSWELRHIHRLELVHVIRTIVTILSDGINCFCCKKFGNLAGKITWLLEES